MSVCRVERIPSRQEPLACLPPPQDLLARPKCEPNIACDRYGTVGRLTVPARSQACLSRSPLRIRAAAANRQEWHIWEYKTGLVLPLMRVTTAQCCSCLGLRVWHI